MLKKNNKNKDKIVLNEKILNFLYNECGLLEDIKYWWLKTIGNDFPINELENIDGDFKGYIKQLRDIIEETEFDRKGNIKTYTSGIIKNYEYDQNNNMTSMKNSNGYYETYEYDKNNNMISMQDSDVYKINYTYDKNNNMIKIKDSYGYYETYEYDQNNNKIKYEDSDGYSYTYEYDKNNNMISYKGSNGLNCTYEYDKNNNMISYKNNNMISYKGSNVDETYKYNITSKRIDIEFFSKGKLQDKCSIPLTYRNKNLDNSIEEPKKEQEKVNEFSLPNLSI